YSLNQARFFSNLVVLTGMFECINQDFLWLPHPFYSKSIYQFLLPLLNQLFVTLIVIGKQ
ncbi:hypothetical protein, partial [Peribacillus frigoritolerans]|uniref:hypothetical protein n=1 Tax=Peribacillus frigoritolerans TaxID=450367 RepID=UPI0020249DEF